MLVSLGNPFPTGAEKLPDSTPEGSGLPDPGKQSVEFLLDPIQLRYVKLVRQDVFNLSAVLS